MIWTEHESKSHWNLASINEKHLLEEERILQHAAKNSEDGSKDKKTQNIKMSDYLTANNVQ